MQNNRTTHVAIDVVYRNDVPCLADYVWSWYVSLLTHHSGLACKSRKATDWLSSVATDRWLPCWYLGSMIQLNFAYHTGLTVSPVKYENDYLCFVFVLVSTSLHSRLLLLSYSYSSYDSFTSFRMILTLMKIRWIWLFEICLDVFIVYISLFWNKIAWKYEIRLHFNSNMFDIEFISPSPQCSSIISIIKKETVFASHFIYIYKGL